MKIISAYRNSPTAKNSYAAANTVLVFEGYSDVFFRLKRNPGNWCCFVAKPIKLSPVIKVFNRGFPFSSAMITVVFVLSFLVPNRMTQCDQFALLCHAVMCENFLEQKAAFPVASEHPVKSRASNFMQRALSSPNRMEILMIYLVETMRECFSQYYH